MSTGNAEVNFIIEDENAKINLNTASAFVLQNFFRFVGRTSDVQAEALADAVIDYRDSDDYVTGQEQNAGSERGVYRQAGLAYGPKNHDFEFIEELALVPGMTKEIYSFVENYITIYGEGRVNINTCGKEALCAAGLEPELADKILALRSGKGTSGAGHFVFTDVSTVIKAVSDAYKLSPQEAGSLDRAIVHGEFCVASNAFRIKGRTRIPGQEYAGKFVCVYVARNGIRYWAQT